jgi:diguanylate cyclase (GGDEF)-like protein/PAS domain S-box-containing protein
MELDDLRSSQENYGPPAGGKSAGGSTSDARSEAMLHALDACNDGVLIVAAIAPMFPIIHANPAFCRITGCLLEQLVGASAAILADTASEPGWTAILNAALNGPGVRAMPQSGVRADATPYWSEVSISKVPAGAQQPDHLVCIARDVTEQRIQKSRLAYLSTHDELTGLANRNLFNERLQRAMADAATRGEAVAVLCLSFDGLGLVNESLGHVARDAFVTAVATRLSACLRGRGALSRHADNEFVLLLDNGSVEQTSAVCDQIREDLAAPLEVAGQRLYPVCSIGVARYPHDGGDEVTLLRYADMALSHARREGGNRYQFFTQEMNHRTAERIHMEAALRVAVAQGQLQLQYQPVADLQQGAVCALEALLRWQHPVEGLISARRFISVAEEAGLTTAIGEWTLARACADIAAWREAGLPPARVAINISPKQFRDPGLAQSVAAALRRADIGPELLALEVTEAALMQDPQASAQTMAQLAALGVGLTLDDFGTGYSSLNHLKRFPLDLVKIDYGLTGNVANGTDEAALVKTIIAMAHHLGLRVAAVGVETEAQCDFLRRNMCDQVQGHFFGEPTTFDAVSGMLASHLSLPPHLLRIQKQKRTLLLVDDEPNIVSALKRLLRRDNYQILTAHSGQEGLEVLAANAVDVIVSDQRMPGMIGADFLRAAKGLYPDTIRIMLSGYTELQSVTDAVNEGAIYKFLTKPWDDEQLRGHIAEAFSLKEIADDNERLNLELRTANHELAAANRRMEDLLRQKQQQITTNEISLSVARDLLQFIPLAVVGLDEDGMVAFINAAAERVFAQSGAILGNEASLVLPELFPNAQMLVGSIEVTINGRRYQAVPHSMGASSESRGNLITLSLCEEQT